MLTNTHTFIILYNSKLIQHKDWHDVVFLNENWQKSMRNENETVPNLSRNQIESEQKLWTFYKLWKNINPLETEVYCDNFYTITCQFSEEISLQDFLVFLKWILQNYCKILKKYYLVLGTTTTYSATKSINLPLVEMYYL